MNKLQQKLLFRIIAVITVLIVIGGGSFYFGFQQGVKQPKTIIVRGVTNLEPEQQVTADFSVFWEAWQKLRDNHVKGREATDQSFIYGAIAGITNSLKDPNTVFFPPEDSKKFEEDVIGEFGGIGAEIGIRNDQLVVVAPLEGSPAEKAGIKAGDKILAIDGENTAGLGVDEAVKKIRGEINTKVILTILRNGEVKSQDVTIIRQKIEVPTLKLDVLENNIAHIKLFSFNKNAPFLFYRSALTILLGKANGIILDLRNNPGGFLEVAVNLAGWFLEKGQVVVTEKFRSGDEIVFRADGTAALKNIPLVILINKGSASASEILAGALRDHYGTKLIGEKSFGKGTVQELFALKDDSKLKITVANWLLPKGQTIEDNGLIPDVEVKLTEEDINKNKDPQLEKALEILKTEISTKAKNKK
jgi:carboxyl-terminal processing protease